MADGPTTQERIQQLLQELENEDTGDLVTSFVVIARTELLTDPGLNGYRHYWSGPLDARLGLLRYATLRAEHAVTDDMQEDDRG